MKKNGEGNQGVKEEGRKLAAASIFSKAIHKEFNVFAHTCFRELFFAVGIRYTTLPLIYCPLFYFPPSTLQHLETFIAFYIGFCITFDAVSVNIVI